MTQTPIGQGAPVAPEHAPSRGERYWPAARKARGWGLAVLAFVIALGVGSRQDFPGVAAVGILAAASVATAVFVTAYRHGPSRRR